MTRDKALKAINRMMDYVSMVDTQKAEIMNELFDDDMREAYLRTLEEIEIDDLDRETKRFFIEDDEEYEKELALLIDDAKKIHNVGMIYAKHLGEIIDDED